MKERLPYLSHRQQQCMTTVACLGGSRQQQHLLHLHRRPVVVSHSSGSSGIMSSNTASLEDAKAMMKMHSLQSQLTSPSSQYDSKASLRHQQTSVDSSDGTDQVDSAQSQLERLDLSSSKIGNEEEARLATSAEPIQNPSHLISPPSQKPGLDPVKQACPEYIRELPQQPEKIATACAASRGQFLVFIKILFKVLDQAQEVHTRNRAKKLVAECTRKNRQGDPLYTPLMEAVQKRLRLFVGEAHWRKSVLLLRHYNNHQQRQRQAV